MPPKPVSKKAKQKMAAAAMVAASSSDALDSLEAAAESGEEGAGIPKASTPKVDAAGVPDAATISGDSARDDTSTVGTAATKETSLDTFLADAKPGEDLHWRLMSQAMDSINITTSTYQSKVHPNSKDVALTNVSLILKGRELVTDANITLNWGQRYGLLGPNGECGPSSHHLASRPISATLRRMQAAVNRCC